MWACDGTFLGDHLISEPSEEEDDFEMDLKGMSEKEAASILFGAGVNSTEVDRALAEHAKFPNPLDRLMNEFYGNMKQELSDSIDLEKQDEFVPDTVYEDEEESLMEDIDRMAMYRKREDLKSDESTDTRAGLQRDDEFDDDDYDDDYDEFEDDVQHLGKSEINYEDDEVFDKVFFVDSSNNP